MNLLKFSKIICVIAKFPLPVSSRTRLWPRASLTQHCNRRERVFFGAEDYRTFLDLLAAPAQESGTLLIARCLMPNHMHLVAVPESKCGRRALLGDADRRYTALINARNRWTWHLWQGRFGSVAMDEDRLTHAVRYVSLNPLRARLVALAQDWSWSSVRAHLSGRSDDITDIWPILDRLPDFSNLIAAPVDEAAATELRRAETRGRPLGPAAFVAGLEKLTGRTLHPRMQEPRPAEKQTAPRSSILHDSMG